MSDYNTMTAAQCADWLAEEERWEPFNGGWRREIPERREYEYRDDHPFSLTLDAAAAALREPWRLKRVEFGERYGAVWTAHVERGNGGYKLLEVDAHDRMTAEYRAAVAARMEDDK